MQTVATTRPVAITTAEPQRWRSNRRSARNELRPTDCADAPGTAGGEHADCAAKPAAGADAASASTPAEMPVLAEAAPEMKRQAVTEMEAAPVPPAPRDAGPAAAPMQTFASAAPTTGHGWPSRAWPDMLVMPAPMVAKPTAPSGDAVHDVHGIAGQDRTRSEPVSTFSIDVDTASYTYVRRTLNEGWLPEPDAVRVEELINYFDYDYPAPTDAATPFKPTVQVYPTPWNAQTQIVQIGIKGYVPPADGGQAIEPGVPDRHVGLDG